MLNNTIHVWHTVLDDHLKHYKLFQSWLSIEEKTRAEKLKRPYRQRFILTRGILRNLLADYSDHPPVKIHFSYTQLGKPLFISPTLNKQIEFNLSHSKERVAFAFTQTTPIGIDLEYNKAQRKYIDKIAYRFFSAHDYEHLKRLHGKEKLNTFFKLWVHNEALLKALGRHLQTHPFSKFKTTSASVAMKEMNLCTLFPLALHPDFSAAVAINGNSKPIIIKKY
jgi:4'-phosphopantetheinyl transferase